MVNYDKWNRLEEYSSDEDVFKKDNTEIFMYLFAHSFHNRVRLYTPPEAHDFQERFDKLLGPAAIRIFLSVILADASLAETYLINNVHLNTWKALNRLFWPLIRVALIRYFDVSKDSVEDAWKTVQDIFDDVSRRLEDAGPKSYIAGETFTAADISFAAHATLVLFPNDSDDISVDYRWEARFSNVSEGTRSEAQLGDFTKATIKI
ncbi:hypothetical protein HDU96_008675 [Phlyctochytrium bullatum]|nr:hypothetical protein HDU96_008675 [Phlyctochytrium bullatum]